MQLTTTQMLMVPGHVDDQISEFIGNSRSTGLPPVCTSVILHGHKSAMPFENGVWGEGTADLAQEIPPEPLAESCQPPSLAII